MGLDQRESSTFSTGITSLGILGGGLRGGHPLLGDAGLDKGTEGDYWLAWRGWLLAASMGPRGERPGGRGSDLCGRRSLHSVGRLRQNPPGSETRGVFGNNRFPLLIRRIKIKVQKEIFLIG